MSSSLSRLRFEPNQMHSVFACSFHSKKSVKERARFASLQARKSLTAQANTMGSSRPGKATADRCASSSQWVVGASRRLKSQVVVAAEYGGALSLRCYAASWAGNLERLALRSMAARSALMPNPSIERTNTGGPGLFAFASAQPPVSASHLKRWASEKAAMISSLSCLRFEPNQMHSVFASSFHSRMPAEDQARFAAFVSLQSKKSLTAQVNAKGSFRLGKAAADRCASKGQWVVGASRRLKSQVVVAAEYGGGLSLRCYVATMGSQSEPPASRSKAASSALMPNPSIERTCPGKPGHASHLKR